MSGAGPEPGGDSSMNEDDQLEFDEERMRSQLEDTEYDTDLGVELAKDAQRVTAGEIDEDDFFERYHDRIVEEFGADGRILEDLDNVDADDINLDNIENGAEDGKGLKDQIEGIIEQNDDVSRREIMKKGGVAAFALSLFAGTQAEDRTAAADDGDSDDNETQWGMTINLNNCDGCLQCMVGCQQENNLNPGENWMYVFTYDDKDQDDENFLVRPCQHCDDAPCEKVCPVGARHTRKDDGLVLTDYDICIGCRYCQVACPYGVNYFGWHEPEVSDEEIEAMHADMEGDHIHDKRGRRVDSRPIEGVMGKCTFCPTRQDGLAGEDKVGTTACEDACTMDAIHFGDMNDPESDPNQHLKEYREEHPNDQSQFPDRPDDTVSTFRLQEELGTKPNVRYIGNEPADDAEQVEGPVTYEAMGLVDERNETDLMDGGTLG